MKSPIPNALAYFFASFGALVASFVVVAAVKAVEPSPRVITWVGGGIMLLALVALMYNVLGIVAGLRYQQERKTLNWIGAVSNGLLLLIYLVAISYAFWRAGEVTATRRLGGPVEIARDTK